MWDDGLESVLGSVWEVLSKEHDSISTDELRKKTGLGLSPIYAALNKMTEVDILDVADRRNNLWCSKKKIDAMAYARAVEIGIPLLCLEKTIGLSVNDRKKAEKIVSSGAIDQEQKQRREQKVRVRQTVLRGRAASRAATTDLAKIVQDAHDAFGSDRSPNRIQQEIAQEAARALEALVSALEKKA